MSYIIPIVLILILIIANGIFVAAEFAIVASRKAKLEELKQAGNAAAQFLLNTMKDAASKDRYIAIAQLGITLASIGLGMYGEKSIAGWLYGPLEHLHIGTWHLGHSLAHTVATIIAVSALTYLHVVLGEMIPKALALHMPEATALRVVTPMRLVGRIFAPIVAGLNAIGMGLLRLLGIPVAGHGQHYTARELEQLVEESYQGGEVDARQHELIANIFHFNERTVGQLMTPRTKVLGIHHEATRADLLQLMRETGHSRFPVYEDSLDHIVGILHIKDFVKASNDALHIRSLMRRAPRVPEHSSAQSLLESFKRLHLHMAVVSNEFGGTAGIVTLEDLLEEVVGEVHDEYDEASTQVTQLNAQEYQLAGDTLLLDLQEDYGITLAAEHSETVAGVLLERLARAAQVGDEITVGDYRLQVLECEGLTITSVLLHVQPSTEPAA